MTIVIGSGSAEALFATFADSVTTKFRANAPGQPEDQLRAPLESLLRGVGATLSKTVVAKGESLLPGRLGKPDYAVLVDGALSGYLELKPPGRGASPNRYKGRDHDQWKRFKAIPNLLYTDGNEWAIYRSGEREGRLVKLPGDVAHDGASAVDAKAAANLLRLLAAFFSWTPIVPTSPSQLAQVLAPLCRLLRDQVRDSLAARDSPLRHLARDWRALLFPEADDDQFADAYAQTVTYALLLARADGATKLDPASAAAVLGADHALLSRALQVLTDPSVEVEIGSALALLQRTVAAMTPGTLVGKNPDPWLYFYETFLAEYDPRLRKNAGVYFTPVQVVRCQVRMTDDLLRTRLHKPKGFAEAGVQTLDPAVGTGTYLLGAITHTLAQVETKWGPGAVPGEATTLGRSLYGFELLVGPYAVAQLRVTREIKSRSGSLPTTGPQVYLTDTLEDPAAVPAAPPLFHKPIADEHRRAQEVKDRTQILVCMGNPPYDRHDASSRLGGWIRHGAKGRPAPLEDFTEPARVAGYGVHLKNIYNLYVYFWRWAIWKVFEHTSATGPGIVTYISASSYLSGPGFVGMREKLRRECDEIWIIDLGGDNRGTRAEPNVFDIQVPVAIAVAVRYGAPHRTEPAVVHYTRVRGDRAAKLAALDSVTSVSDFDWEDCPSGWQDPMRPAGVGSYFRWPALADLMPWQHSGVQAKRSWPIGPDEATLSRRWATLLASSSRADAFKETRDRKVSKTYSSPTSSLQGGPPLASEPNTAPTPPIVSYAFRSFDRQKLLADNRLIDFPRPVLWQAHSDEQIYLSTLTSTPIGRGPAVTAAADIPDLHHFRGSYGGKDTFPLWRDAEATDANIQPGLLEAWSKQLGRPITPHQFFAYVYAVLASPAYTNRFFAELEVPGPRVPLTARRTIFERAVALGEELVFLHTFGRRYRSAARAMPHGRARAIAAVSDDPSNYPNEFFYDEETHELRVGDGVFAPVAPEVWKYEVSGLQVVESWLDFRMRERGGKKSSPLDDISPERWTPQFTAELLELIWVLEATLRREPQQRALLEEIVRGPIWDPSEVAPAAAERRGPPDVVFGQGALFVLSGEQPQLDQDA